MNPNIFPIIRNGSLTFFIGFIAGISPFVFMQVLPSLLYPSVPFEIPNYYAIVLTGILVGAITSIIYTTNYKSSESQDVFFHALGIPAILIAVVSNLGAEFKTEQEVSKIQSILSSQVQQESTPAKNIETPELVPKPSGLEQNSYLVGTAWSDESEDIARILLAQGSYLLVIDEYADSVSAWNDYNRYMKMQLKTEMYVPKNLNVYQLSSGNFVLAYGQYMSKEEADKAYKLLIINDPYIHARLLQY